MSTTQQTETNTPETIKFHPVILKLFEKRDMSSEEIQDFLSWDLRKLPDLTLLNGMEETVTRIIEAMDNNETIGIYGDYDVDGTTSCALFYHFFKMFDIKVETIQPSRFVEGYGIHPSSIDKAQGLGIKLLLTVDCGISNNEAAEYAKERGLDLIITDHHKDAREEMPNAFAVVNPNRRDEPEDSPLRPLAGVAVAFAVCLAVKNRLETLNRKCPSIYPLLQFAAIGTICDLAKLTPVNLKIVRHGLKQIKDTQYPGIKVFFSKEDRGLDIIPSEKLSFHLGPMINSKGRLDHPEKALELLTCDDSSKAFENYSILEISNKERKFIQADVYSSAKEQFIKQLNDDTNICIVYDPEWHEGVIGIVASRMVENFKMPAIIFTNSEKEGVIKASARTAGGLSIFDLLNDNSDLFLKFGGHKAAAGLSMPLENLPLLKERLNEALASVPAIERTVTKTYDVEIKPEDVNPTLVKQLELLEPFGMGNSKPVFKMKGFKLDSYDLLKEVHVRWNFSSLENPKVKLKGISFNYVGKWEALHPEELFKNQNIPGNELCAFFTLGINRFNGNQYIQLMVDKIEPGTF
ncbi:MAG: single-stranded-DNA-specific exonuclease RecJ [Bacteriovoracaceae bacterium]|nr:single-stranded-DNA-specific exonuclease RecJ [Bacteriovoracaceae bacterium]